MADINSCDHLEVDLVKNIGEDEKGGCILLSNPFNTCWPVYTLTKICIYWYRIEWVAFTTATNI